MPASGDTGDFARRLSADLPDRYELVREHGRGGMATVYLAVDRKHDRNVALKVLAPELAAGIGADRFLREIQIAAHLNHPHIVPLLDSGVVDGRPFYVMPFVEGESLRERLSHEGRLSVDEALRIAHDVAEALTYAHEHGVIHRDIKPGNVLLTAGSAVVTDFGIASAINQAPGEHLTRTGLSVGTIGYMSPEQASGDRDVDARTDQYSLACVLFEMLAGRLPFDGGTARAILGRQLTVEPADLTAFLDVPAHELAATVRRALARDPAARFSTTSDFADELVRNAAAPSGSSRFKTRPAIWAALAVSVLVAAGSWFLPRDRLGISTAAAEVRVDTARYAVFPFENRAGSSVDIFETLRLRRALGGWQGLNVVPYYQVGEALSRTGREELNTREAADVARNLGAGRFLKGGVVRDGNSLTLQTTLFAATAGGPQVLAHDELRLPADMRLPDAAVDSLFEEHIVRLLWLGRPPPHPRSEVGTRTLPAWQAFHYGEQALQQWDLVRADSGFRRAAELDPSYAEAHLWIAIVRLWNGEARTRWRIAAQQAYQRREVLSGLDRGMARAVVLQGEGDFEQACPEWDRLAQEYPQDFAPRYGLAVCLHADRTVIRDVRSPSGWAYRSSRARMIEAFEQAFLRLPAVLASFRSNSYAPLRGLLMISGDRVVPGHARAPDSTTFRAYPAWIGDTLAYLPRPVGTPTFRSAVETRQKSEALRRQRLKFMEIAETWAANSPASSAAREALAIAMAMFGDRAAIDTLRRGRLLATGPDESYRMAANEVWLLVAFSAPFDEDGLQQARRLADSLLANPLEADSDLAAGLAFLRGRVEAAVAYSRQQGVNPTPLPESLAGDAHALLLYAAAGGPYDSLRSLENRVVASVEAEVESRHQQTAYQWLALPTALAFPAVRLDLVERTADDWIVGAQRALERSDTVAVREQLERFVELREEIEPYDLTMDALYPEAHLWLEVGEGATAAEWLDQALDVLPRVPNQLFVPERIGALVRAFALRAEIARALGEAGDAARWARTVMILWGDGDAFLHPLISEMRALVEESSD